LSSGEDLQPAEPDLIITSTLLPLQKQGLAFLLDRKSPSSKSAYALWTKSPMSTGQSQVWRHIITSEEHVTSDGLPPPSPLGSLLANDMGLGKSLQTISLIASTLSQACDFALNDHSLTKIQATLVICPANLIDNWQAEVIKHTCPDAINTLVYHGRQRHKLLIDELRSYHVVTTSYQVVATEWRSKISGKTPNDSHLFSRVWFRVVLDEAQ
jgi:SNF2 family DNA or RNA helicase